MGYAPDWMRQSYRKVKHMADGGEASLQDIESKEGLAPYGFRHSERAGDPIEVKGKGYNGMLPHKLGGTSTEISSDNGKYDFPLIVPTLSKEERKYLLENDVESKDFMKNMPDGIMRKAEEHAEKRKKSGKNAFATPTELRYPKD
jgi:hypothetical protein